MVDWEQRYREGDTPWEKGAAAPPLRVWLSRHAIGGHVLVPGCGSGHDVRLLAASGAGYVLGLDIAPSALRAAGEYPPVGPEEYRLGDICDLPADLQGRFDWVFEHTCFCALDPSQRAAYVRGATRALKPGGRILGVFFPHTGNPPGEGPPFSISPRELDAAFEDEFQLRECRIPAVGYPGRVGCEELRILQKRA